MRYYVLLLLLLVSFNLKSQTRDDYITTLPLNIDTICPGTSFTLSATASGHFLDGNVFYAEISDIYGDFSIPDTIGFLQYSNSGPEVFQVDITAEITRLYTYSTLYRIRIVSSNPELIGSDNGSDITIENFPIIEITGEPYACLGDTLVYTASESIYSYQWLVNGGQIIGSSTGRSVSIYWNNTGNYSITLNYATEFGCSASANLDIVVSTKPIAYIVGQEVVCVNDEKIYYAADNSSTSYDWIVIGGTIEYGTGTDSISVLWNSIGYGKVILNQGNNGCIARDTIDIDVAPNPYPEIIGKEIVCENTVEVYKTHGEGLNFFWIVEGGTIIDSDIDSTVSVYWENPGTGTITLQQTNYAFCKASISINVIIERKPSPSISGATNVCYNDYQTYKTPISNNTNEWFIQGGEIVNYITDNEIEVQWNGADIGLVTLIQTNYAGCKDTVIREITINTLPTPYIYGDSYFCQYSTAIYAASPIAGNNNKWSVQGGEIIEQMSSDSVLVRWDDAEYYSITLTQITISGCVDSLVLPVTIVKIPDVTINGELSACAHQPYIYTTTSESASINWEVEGGSIDGAADFNEVKIIWDSPGEGIIKLKKQTFSLGCSDSNSITVQINPKPETPIIIREGDSLKSSSANGNQWYFGFDNQTPIADATSQYYTPVETGYYSVITTDDNGCFSDISELFYFEITSVDDIISNSNISVYPNPAKNRVNILSNQDYYNAHILILNILGEAVYSSKGIDLQKENVFSIELNNFSAGTYFIQIKQKDVIYNNKIIIE